VVDGGAVALMGNRLVVQLAPPDNHPRPGIMTNAPSLPKLHACSRLSPPWNLR
jgi:hypothetical protein